MFDYTRREGYNNPSQGVNLRRSKIMNLGESDLDRCMTNKVGSVESFDLHY